MRYRRDREALRTLAAQVIPMRERGLSFAVIARIVRADKRWLARFYRKWGLSVDETCKSA